MTVVPNPNVPAWNVMRIAYCVILVYTHRAAYAVEGHKTHAYPHLRLASPGSRITLKHTT